MSIGKVYANEVVCDVIEMDACHILLGRPWQYDRNITYRGKANTCSFDWHGRWVILIPSLAKASKKRVPRTTQALLTISRTKMTQKLKNFPYLLALLVKEITNCGAGSPLP